MTINIMIRICLVSALGTALAGDTALARGRVGGMSGGMRGGMGVGMGYSGGMRGGTGYSGGVRGGMGSPSFSRPGMGSGYRPGSGMNRYPAGHPGTGGGNRTNLGNNIGGGNRPNIGNNIGNRANINTGNRTNIGGGTNIGINNRPSNINVNRINNNRNLGNWSGAGWGLGPINRAGYRHGWVNGFWRGSRWGFGTGLATGGLIGWGWGAAPYYWGYSSFVNPFYVPVPVPPGVPQSAASSFNYAQPINTQAPPPGESVLNSAELVFDNARGAFMKGEYNQAMDLVNQVITRVPNDATAHEFRALVFFALKNYDQAAATLYPVLSVGPGWDWTTLVGLYPNLGVYTGQLRALEAACKANPESASNQFVLGYHYLTEGHADAAAHLFEDVARLQPDNRLAAQLAREFSTDDKADPAPPVPEPASSFEPKEDSLFGTWKTSPSKDVSIELTLPEEGDFTWKVVQKGIPQTFTGEFSASDDLLTLARADNGPVLVGNLIWQDEKNFQFHLANTDPNDPGIMFSKTTRP